MTPDKAARILREHNKWRRGLGEYEHAGARFPHDSKTLGLAIDVALEALERENHFVDANNMV